MKSITLSNGFKCKVNENVANDMELLDLLKETKEDGTAYSDIVLKIFGKEQRDKLYDSIRTKDGIVPLIKSEDADYSITDAVTEILTALGTSGKN